MSQVIPVSPSTHEAYAREMGLTLEGYSLFEAPRAETTLDRYWRGSRLPIVRGVLSKFMLGVLGMLHLGPS